MSQEVDKVAYSSTGYFSKLVGDYLSGNEYLREFYEHTPTLDGIKASIEARKAFNTNRELLVEQLTIQYKGISLTELQQNNLQLLLRNDTFTITTAHQPNIFTGPLYFIYKILHAIKLANELKEELLHYNFVPVYYMGSEDADLDELGYINLGGEKLVWRTKQSGAVGRMIIDKDLHRIINKIQGQLGVLPFGQEVVELFIKCYSIGKSIQQATLELVNALFSDFGLLIVIPDNRALKASFHRVIEKELKEQFSHKCVALTIEKLSRNYKVQAGGREINLFYLFGDKRERILLIEGKNGKANRFIVPDLDKDWLFEEVLKELSDYPERFSANVILRGVFQETILPNIAFIGGGGELAYWLELKKVFNAVNVPYPVLILRNSFLMIPQNQQIKIDKLGLKSEDLFLKEFDLVKKIVKDNSTHQLSLDSEIAAIRETYHQLKITAEKIDKTLVQHVDFLEKGSIEKLLALEKKFVRSEKRKFGEQQKQVAALKISLFPNNNLQERIENIAYYYAKEGKDWIQKLYNSSAGIDQRLTILKLSSIKI